MRNRSQNKTKAPANNLGPMLGGDHDTQRDLNESNTGKEIGQMDKELYLL